MLDVSAGIVLYNPQTDRLKQCIDSIIKQVKRLYIVNNGSDDEDSIINLVSRYKSITYIKNDKNLGIAKALNQICENACYDHFEWVLTLDQDTICPLNLIESLVGSINDDRVAIVCPAVHYEGWNKQPKRNYLRERIDACMTSASLTRIDAWEAVGGFREEFFIDFVDNDFCKKLVLHGYHIIRNNQCTINHQLGESHNKRILFGGKVDYSIHSPIRYYYMVRNNIVFIHDYKDSLNITKEWIKLHYIIACGLLFSKDKHQTFLYIKKGFIAARKKNMGILK